MFFLPGEVRFSDRSLKFGKTHFSLERVSYPQLVIMANYYERFKHFLLYTDGLIFSGSHLSKP